MNENLKKFIAKFMNDGVLQQKMNECKSEDECYELALSVQDGFTFDEFKETMAQMRSMGDELSMDDLASAAGGMSPEAHDWVVGTSVSVSSVVISGAGGYIAGSVIAATGAAAI